MNRRMLNGKCDCAVKKIHATNRWLNRSVVVQLEKRLGSVIVAIRKKSMLQIEGG